MSIAPPVLPVLSRIQAITSRFEPAAAVAPSDGSTSAASGTFAASLSQALDGTAAAGGATVDPAGPVAKNDVGSSDAALLAMHRAGLCPCSDCAATAAAGSTPTADLSAVAGSTGSEASAASVGSGTISSHPGFAGAAPYEAMFEAAGSRHGVDPKLLAAVARTESNFRADARSGAGAVGLMQFMPATARGLRIDPTDPAQAIDGAARYLRQQLDRFGSVDLAVAAYNAGPGAVSRFGGVPPYSETRTYVSKVLGAYRALG